MARRAEFFVAGTPVPQGSVDNYRGRIVAVKKPLKDWRAAIAMRAAETPWGALGPLDAPCSIQVTFFLAKPMKPKFWVPAVKPDGDKLLRAVQDALTKVLVKDDCVFIMGSYKKRYGVPGAFITITEITNEHLTER